jgi:serine/threonine protein kinase
MLLLGEQKYCHSDIKPENITLVQVQGDRYLVKVIDFGELSRDDEVVQNKFTPNYFLNPMREYEYNSKNNIIFKNIEERLNNEFFTIVRTMQRLMIEESRVSEDFTIQKDLIASNK